MKKATYHTIDFEPSGRSGKCRKGESLLACAHRLGVGINSVCNGRGTCHSCKVRIRKGTVTKPTREERDAFTSQELKDGWRLACRTRPLSDCKMAVPPESMPAPQRLQFEGLEIKVRPRPSVRACRIKMSAPSLSDPGSDADRMLQALHRQHRLNCSKIDINVLRVLSAQLRSWNWEVQAVVRRDEVIAVQPWPCRQLGLAIDLGTSKIAGYLVNLQDGCTLAAGGISNPQSGYGEDIISRITPDRNRPDKGALLQKVAVEAINQLCAGLCAEANASTEEIYEAVLAGNTAMHHLFLGLPVMQLAVSPFVPAESRPLDIKASDLGLHTAAGAYVHLLPNIAGFVGSDHVAMLLAIKASRLKGPVVALDIGTNTEVSLIHDGDIISTSCASGPAFEGGHIKSGMRATTGAIERLQIKGDTVRYQTIGGAPPIGICGSGVLDALSQLYLAEVIDKSGRIMDNHPRVRTCKGQREFVLVCKEERGGKPAITITQHDVRELQLAKAAIRCGIQALLESAGCSKGRIKKVIIAGAFGNYINAASAVAIGMLPSLPLNYFRQAGNAAGTGARLALVSLSMRAEAQRIASRVEYIELAGTPGFQHNFIQAGYLGPY